MASWHLEHVRPLSKSLEILVSNTLSAEILSHTASTLILLTAILSCQAYGTHKGALAEGILEATNSRTVTEPLKLTKELYKPVTFRLI